MRFETLIVGVYVDDLFILYSHSDDLSLYHCFLKVLTKRWDVEDEGEVSDLLNVEMTRSAEVKLLFVRLPTSTSYWQHTPLREFCRIVSATKCLVTPPCLKQCWKPSTPTPMSIH